VKDEKRKREKKKSGGIAGEGTAKSTGQGFKTKKKKSLKATARTGSVSGIAKRGQNGKIGRQGRQIRQRGRRRSSHGREWGGK